MQLLDNKSWFAGVSEYVKLTNPTEEGESDAKEFARLNELIETKQYQKVLDLCMKYGEPDKNISSAGFVKTEKENKQNPLKGFCQYVVARLFELVANDEEKATEFYEHSVKNGCVYAIIRVSESMVLDGESDEEKAHGLRTIKKYALSGYPMALVKYAELLFDKAETKAEKNYVFELLRIANSYENQEDRFIDEHILYYLLGRCYEEGFGTPKNTKFAIAAYRLSLNCYQANEFYDNIDTILDIAERMIASDTAGNLVFQSLKQVSELGYLDAVMKVIDTYNENQNKNAAEVLEVVARVALSYRELSEAEKGKVYLALANYYMNKDHDKALSNLFKASSQKNPEAIRMMAFCLANGGFGLGQDEDQAFKMCSQLVAMEGVKESTLIEAYRLLAELIFKNIGKYEWASEEAMIDCYKKSMELGDVGSLTTLALLTFEGKVNTGITKDEAKKMIDELLESSNEGVNDASVLFNLAKIYSYEEMGADDDKVLDTLDDALIISYDDAPILEYKGTLLLKLGREEDALDVWAEMTELYAEYVESVKEESEFVKAMQNTIHN